MKFPAMRPSHQFKIVQYEPQKSTISQVYKDRLKSISNKETQQVIEHLANHIERRENIDFEISDHLREIASLKDKAQDLGDLYEKTFERDVMRQKIEVEAEIQLLTRELEALNKKRHTRHAWTIPVSQSEVEALRRAYEPLGKTEQRLFADLVKLREAFLAAREEFMAEYESNTETHNTLVGVLRTASATHVELNRVPEHEVKKNFNI